MKTYTIAELEILNKVQIEEIVNQRGDLLLNLISKVFKDETFSAFKSKKTQKSDEDILVNISEVKSKNKIEHLKENNAVLLLLEIDLEVPKEMNKDLVYNEDQAYMNLSELIKEKIDDKARILWNIEKKKNTIQLRLLFPDNLIVPELVAYEEKYS
jgi:predicted nucleotidyltransferase